MSSIMVHYIFINFGGIYFTILNKIQIIRLYCNRFQHNMLVFSQFFNILDIINCKRLQFRKLNLSCQEQFTQEKIEVTIQDTLLFINTMFTYQWTESK